MPYAWTNKKIKLGTFDRRKSGLTDEDREDIKKLHQENTPVREIARRYKNQCSRRLIQFIIYPERLKQLQDRNKENEHWKKYHNRKKLTTAVRNWRQYKNRLIKTNKL